jgi:nucleotide-binding universal stress UspA family protein
MYGTILVPLDGSPFAEQAIPMAISVARANEARVVLLSSRRAPPVDLSDGEQLDEMGATFDLEDARQYLGEVAARFALPPERIETIVESRASAVEAIRHRIALAGVDLVIMSTHGRTGLRRTLVGSVADGVVRHCHVPMLLWRPDDDWQEAPDHPSAVLVPLDGSPYAETVLKHAATLAGTFGVPLTLLRVVAPVPIASEMLPAPAVGGAPFGGGVAVLDATATKLAVEHAEEYLVTTARRLRRTQPGLTIANRVTVAEHAGRTILETAFEVGADVVAMTTHGRGVSRLLTGSTVDTVMRGRTGATLLVRPPAE